jgi:ketosteroid isomerase-like protein
MKAYVFTAIAAACLSATAALAATPAAAPAAKAAPSDEAQIRALESRFAAGVRAKDVNAIMRVYTPGADLLVFDVVPPRQYAGAAAYRKDWSDLMAGMKGPVKFSISDLKIGVGGNLAYSHSIQTLGGTGAKGPETMTLRVTDVYRKSGGAWKIIHEHVSAPIDLDTGKPDLTSKP